MSSKIGSGGTWPHFLVSVNVRLQGLMGGIELAPPTADLKWGRKVCAGAVERGVLLRPLGDVIVLMPMLTSTISEIDRIVDAVGRSHFRSLQV